MIAELAEKIRIIPDFPKKGISYKDITTLLQDADALATLQQFLVSRYQDYGLDYVVGIESRGFIFGAMLAVGLGVGFVPVRKAGKLPYHVHQEAYTLEYGEDVLEVHQDVFQPGAKVLLIDDLLATGGTLRAATSLIEKAGGTCVEACCLIELLALEGRGKLNVPFYSVLTD